MKSSTATLSFSGSGQDLTAIIASGSLYNAATEGKQQTTDGESETGWIIVAIILMVVLSICFAILIYSEHKHNEKVKHNKEEAVHEAQQKKPQVKR
jgi:uncharacterized membrane protein